MRNRLLYISIIINLLLCQSVLCQSSEYCAYDNITKELIKNNPSLQVEVDNLEKNYPQSMNSTQRSIDLIELPVVVHIIHDDGPENISDSQVLQAIDWLNDAFANESLYSIENGVNTNIKFCLAQRDTSNNEINGILRHKSSLTDMSTHKSNTQLSSISAFDPNQYINLRIVNTVCLGDNCDLGGYAVNALGGSQQFRNGVVVRYDQFGTTTDKNKVLVHEMGHFLGLLHTFHNGCNNDDCLIDGDRVCDTPPDNNVLFANCNNEFNSCDTDSDDISANNPFRATSIGGIGDQLDMIENYMDYSRSSCQNKFTSGQSERMCWYINQRFSSLLSSQACFAPCNNEFDEAYPVFTTSSLANNPDSLTVGEEITYEALLNETDSIIWMVDGVEYSTESIFLFSPSQEGCFIISAQLLNATEGCDDQLRYIDTVKVSCAVLSDFMFFTDSTSIFFESNALDADMLSWQISSNGIVVFSSISIIDTLTDLEPNSYMLCLVASNQFCTDTYCQQVTIYGAGIELCTDGIDNDQDGYIDAYDNDCPCDDELFNTQCPSDCEVVPDSFPEFGIKLKWMSELVNDDRAVSHPVVGNFFTDTDDLEIVSFNQEKINSNSDLESQIVIINASDGVILSSTTFSNVGETYSFKYPAIGDLDNDGNIEIVQITKDSLYIYNNNLDLIKRTSLLAWGFIVPPFVSLADINQDGKTEIIINTLVFNNLGDLILELPFGGCNFDGAFGCAYSNVLVADFLPSLAGLEIAAGDVLYDVTINNITSEVGNSFIVRNADPVIKSGATSMGDINNDGTIDIISIRGTNLDSSGIFVWNPITTELIAKGEALNQGSSAFVGDLNNDCLMEIGVVYRNVLRVYSYNGSNDLSILYDIPIMDRSLTRATLFDFNSDGILEIIYRDEEFLYIFNGLDGSTLFQLILRSPTNSEIPLICDIDNDGEAEIIVTGSGEDDDEDTERIFCFESDGAPWAPARSVWNQYNYHVTNVNDDLTIPQYQQNMAAFFDTDSCGLETCPQPYNGMFMQATNRTQEGCVVFEEDDCIEDEICDDGIDNDQDGYIDAYDNECPCDDELFNAQYPSDCEVVPDSFPEFGIKLKWMSELVNDDRAVSHPVVGNFLKNGESVQILSFSEEKLNSNGIIESRILLLNGFDGTNISSKPFSQVGNTYDFRTPCIGDINNNGRNEIVQVTEDSLYIFDESLSLIKKVSLNEWNFSSSPGVNLADLNQDGKTEIIINSLVFNSNGDLLLDLPFGGCNFFGAFGCSNSNIVVADFLPSSEGLEIAAGNIVYDLNLVNNNSESGNSYVQLVADNEIKSGLTSMGDINNDGQLDIISIRGTNLDSSGIFIWDPLSKELIAKGETLERGGTAFVGDINNDCNIEIGVVFRNNLRVYTYNNSSELDILFDIPIQEKSLTRASIFDFNSDNIKEIVFRDEEFFYIFSGLDGSTLYQRVMTSSTNREVPIICDIDNDGEAEIIVTGSGEDDDDDTERIFCFESDGAPWAPARSVWNQYNYHVTNVNDDLTIPQYQQNMAAFFDTDSCGLETCPQPYNGMFMQATNRTQEGCVVFEEYSFDLSLSGGFSCLSDSSTLCLDVTLESGNTIPDSIPFVVYYSTLSNSTFEYSETFYLLEDSFCFQLETPIDLDFVLIRLNSLDSIFPPTEFSNMNTECDYSNNELILPISRNEVIMDLGPDIIKCDSDVVTLSAGTGFESYLWSDLSSDSTYSTNLVGMHYVEATDSCGVIFRDSVFILTDTTLSLDLIFDNSNICIGDEILIYPSQEFDTLNWYVDNILTCGGCDSLELTLESDVLIEVVGSLSGCLASDSLEIKVLPTYNDTIIEVICSGDSVTIDGLSYLESGIFNIILETENGCDSTIMFDLTVNTSDTTSWDIQLCEGDSVLVNGQNYFDNAFITFTDLSVYGCDSISEISIQLVEEIIDTSYVSICEGDSINIFGDFESIEGEYSFGYITLSGCDSTSTVILTFDSVAIFQIDSLTCQGDTLFINGKSRYEEGVYFDTLTTISGCDSIIELQLLFFPSYIDTIDHVICNGDSIEYEGSFYFDSGVHQIELESTEGCDSIITLSIDVLDILSAEEEVSFCEGDSLLLHGQWVTTSGEYPGLFQAESGCDSVFTYIVTTSPIYSSNSSLEICQGDSIQIENTWYFGGESVEVVENSFQGCDSIINFTIEVVDILSDEEAISFCEGDSMLLHNQWVSESGEYPELFQAQSGCDSVFTYIVTTSPISSSNSSLEICQGDSIQIENTWYFGGETVEVIENTVEGCDSIITLSIEVVDILSDETPITFCVGDSMLLHNQWIKESGEYTGLFQAQSGCDSVFTYIVTTIPSSSATVERQICEGDSVIIESEIFITEGSFEITTQASNGCDSVITLNLEILARSTGSSDMEFCMGDSLFIDDQWIYESGNYEIHLQNNAGCDSIVSVNVTELPMEMVVDSLFACSGDSILLSGNYYFANQVVSDTIWDDVCPKLRNTTLSFVDLLTTAESIIICQGDTLSVGSLQIFESGTYPLSFISESGCDSIHSITATTLETIFDLPSDTLLTNGNIYEYLLDIDTSVWSVSWTSDDVVIDCESCLLQTWDISETTNITLDIFSDDGCEVSHTFEITLEDSDEIVYPNIFTPNGDGVNDEWIIDMTNYPTNLLQIYDRWGNKIFAQKNVDMISWDGRTNNQEVNLGVYIFMLEYIDLEGGQEMIFGDITVIR